MLAIRRMLGSGKEGTDEVTPRITVVGPSQSSIQFPGLVTWKLDPGTWSQRETEDRGWKITGVSKWHFNLATGLEHLCSCTLGWVMTCHPSFPWVLPKETLGH